MLPPPTPSFVAVIPAELRLLSVFTAVAKGIPAYLASSLVGVIATPVFASMACKVRINVTPWVKEVEYPVLTASLLIKLNILYM
jgi:uncharacterized protein (DUF983 family)